MELSISVPVPELPNVIPAHPCHDEGNKAFDKDVEEGDEAEARNMNDGFIANSSNEQELTENESTTLRYDTLYFIASL